MLPLEVEFTPRFRRSARRLSPDQHKQVAVAADMLREAFGKSHLHSGLGIRRLSEEVYEFRAGRDLRVVFELYGSRAELVLIGNHDDVRKFMMNR